MKKGWIKGMACFLVLALVALFCVGCGGGGGKVTITIGDVTDFTGVAAGALVWTNKSTADMVRYWNDEGLIPGVKLKLVSWDTGYNPARDIPGYEWLKERGVKVIYSVIGSFCETLKASAEKDRIPLIIGGATAPMIDPPGWVFSSASPYPIEIKTVLKWVSENNWDYSKGVPKLGLPGWDEPISKDVGKAVKEYCQVHPDKFDYLGNFVTPVGNTMWSGQVEKLKNCDFVVLTSGMFAPFIKQFHEAGHTATFVGTMAVAPLRGFMVDMCGYDLLDGTLCTMQCPWWGEDSYPMVKLAEETLHRYQSTSEAEELIYRTGASHISQSATFYWILEVLKAAVEEVGADNFDGQAYYNAALQYKSSSPIWKGYPEFGFSQTKRVWADATMIYKFSAEAKDLVRISDWVPLVTE